MGKDGHTTREHKNYLSLSKEEEEKRENRRIDSLQMDKEKKSNNDEGNGVLWRVSLPQREGERKKEDEREEESQFIK